ncbi:MAG TPA: ABC transporter permease [Streptosporangiaceae bacterium]|nr:ABC transporter permease [Streptosporangiaceae bacterium]
MIGSSDLGPAAPPSAAGVPVAQAAAQRPSTPWRLLLRRPTFLVGALILLFWVVCAVFGTTIAPHDPFAQQLLATNNAPSGAHWFGTDQLGRDVFSRVIVGSRNILLIAAAATVLGTVGGTALGLVMGYLGGIVDTLVSRVVEAVLALPVVIVAFLFIVAVGPSTGTVIIIIGLVFTPLIARTVRSAVLVESQLDYLSSARLLGEKSTAIMFTEILPNVIPAVLVEFTVRLGYAVFTVASLSFLGFGVQPPTPDWGADIAANYGVLPAGYWWETLFPALAIASLIVAVNLVTDSIEQVLAS